MAYLLLKIPECSFFYCTPEKEILYHACLLVNALLILLTAGAETPIPCFLSYSSESTAWMPLFRLSATDIE